jgi:holliday junction resolvase YEN1
MRALFHRLNRLIGLPAQAIFVFDGHDKPVKRNKKTACFKGIDTRDAKILIQLFGFIVHEAPGEAEAECAVLQQKGVVDAVLSEDIDTIMFGCTKLIRDMPLNREGSSALTFVTLYTSLELRDGITIDREGLVLIALLSGGDYSPGGIPGCGKRIACEAAAAGYGKSLCRLLPSNKKALVDWRSEFQLELQKNNNGFFKNKHPSLEIPAKFPDFSALNNYLHPKISTTVVIEELGVRIQSMEGPKIDKLREFTDTCLGWTGRIGTVRFIQNLAPSLLIHRLLTENRPYIHRLTVVNKRGPTNAAEFRVQYSPVEIVEFASNIEVDMDKPLEDCQPSKETIRSQHVWVPDFLLKLWIPNLAELCILEQKKNRSVLKSSGMNFGAIEKYLHRSTLTYSRKREREELGSLTMARSIDCTEEINSLEGKRLKRVVIDLTI